MKYLSGPISHEDKKIEQDNLAKFYLIEEMLNARGARCINPADHGASGNRTYEDYLVQDIILIFAHRPDMYFMKGWQESRGARLEHELAIQLGLNIEYELTTL